MISQAGESSESRTTEGTSSNFSQNALDSKAWMRERAPVIYKSSNQNYNDIYNKITVPIHTNICSNETEETNTNFLILNKPKCPLSKSLQSNNEKCSISLEQTEKYGKCDPCYMRKYLECGLQRMGSNDNKLFESNGTSDCKGVENNSQKCQYKKKCFKDCGRDENMNESLQNYKYNHFLEREYRTKEQLYNNVMNNDIRCKSRNGKLQICDQQYSKTWLQCEIMGRMNAVDKIIKYFPSINCNPTSEIYFKTRVKEIQNSCQERKTLISPILYATHTVNRNKNVKTKKRCKLSIVSNSEESNFHAKYDFENLNLLAQENMEKKNTNDKNKNPSKSNKKTNKRKLFEGIEENKKTSITGSVINQSKKKPKTGKRRVNERFLLEKSEEIKDKQKISDLIPEKAVNKLYNENNNVVIDPMKVMNSGEIIVDVLGKNDIRKISDKSGTHKKAKSKYVEQSESILAESFAIENDGPALIISTVPSKELAIVTNLDKDNGNVLEITNVEKNTNEFHNIGLVDGNQGILNLKDQDVEENIINENIIINEDDEFGSEDLRVNDEKVLAATVLQDNIEENVIDNKNEGFKEVTLQSPIEVLGVLSPIDDVKKNVAVSETGEIIMTMEDGEASIIGIALDNLAIVREDSIDDGVVGFNINDQFADGVVIRNDDQVCSQNKAEGTITCIVGKENLENNIIKSGENGNVSGGPLGNAQDGIISLEINKNIPGDLQNENASELPIVIGQGIDPSETNKVLSLDNDKNISEGGEDEYVSGDPIGMTQGINPTETNVLLSLENDKNISEGVQDENLSGVPIGKGQNINPSERNRTLSAENDTNVPEGVDPISNSKSLDIKEINGKLSLKKDESISERIKDTNANIKDGNSSETYKKNKIINKEMIGKDLKYEEKFNDSPTSADSKENQFQKEKTDRLNKIKDGLDLEEITSNFVDDSNTKMHDNNLETRNLSIENKQKFVENNDKLLLPFDQNGIPIGSQNEYLEFSEETETNYPYKNQPLDTSGSKILCLTLNEEKLKNAKANKICDRFPSKKSYNIGFRSPEIRIEPGFITLKSMDLIKKLASQTTCLKKIPTKNTTLGIPLNCKPKSQSLKVPPNLILPSTLRLPLPTCSSRHICCKTEPIMPCKSHNKIKQGYMPLSERRYLCPNANKVNYSSMYDMKCLLNPRECYKYVPKGNPSFK